MTHPHDFALLNDLLDGRLPAGAADELRERIAEEPELQAAWNDLRRMRAGVRALPAPAVPPDFAARVRLRAGIPADAAASRLSPPSVESASHAPQTTASGGRSTVPAPEGARLLGLPRRFFAIAASVGLALGAGTWIFLEKSGYGPESRGHSRQSTAGRSTADPGVGDRLKEPRHQEIDDTLLALEDARRKQREESDRGAPAPEPALERAGPVDAPESAPRGRFMAPGGAVPPALRAPTEAPSAPGAKLPSPTSKPGDLAKPDDAARSAEPTGGGAGAGGVPAPLTGPAPVAGTPAEAPSPTGRSAPATPPPPVPAPAGGPLPRGSELGAAMGESPVPIRRVGAESDEKEALDKAKDAGHAFDEVEKAKKASDAREGFARGRDDESGSRARSGDHEDVLVLRAPNLDVARAQVALLVASLRSPGESSPDVAGFSRAALAAPTEASRPASNVHDADEADPTAAREVDRASLGVLVVDLAPSAFSRLESALATAEEAEGRKLEVERAARKSLGGAQAKAAPAMSEDASKPALPEGPPAPYPPEPTTPLPPAPPPPSSPSTPPSPSSPLPAPAPRPVPVAPDPLRGLEPPPPGAVGSTPAGSGKRGADLQGATDAEKRAEKGREGDAARAIRRVRIVVLPP